MLWRSSILIDVLYYQYQIKCKIKDIILNLLTSSFVLRVEDFFLIQGLILLS